MTGLAFHPTTGVLYGSTGNANTALQGALVTINPATARVTVIGSFNAGPVNGSGSPATMGDIAFDSAGNLYGVATIGGPNLYSINPATGQATVVGVNGASTGAYFWSQTGSYWQCKVANTGKWYMNVRYLN